MNKSHVVTNSGIMKKIEALGLFDRLKHLLEKLEQFLAKECITICNENFILVMSCYDKNWTFDIIYYDTTFRFITDINVSKILYKDIFESRFSTRKDFIEIFDEDFELEMVFRFVNGKYYENCVFYQDKYNEILQAKKKILGDWQTNDYHIRFGESKFKIFAEDNSYVGYYHIHSDVIKLTYGEASIFLNKESDIFKFSFDGEFQKLIFSSDSPFFLKFFKKI